VCNQKFAYPRFLYNTICADNHIVTRASARQSLWPWRLKTAISMRANRAMVADILTAGDLMTTHPYTTAPVLPVRNIGGWPHNWLGTALEDIGSEILGQHPHVGTGVGDWPLLRQAEGS
jgi:hypothetical protein